MKKLLYLLAIVGMMAAPVAAVVQPPPPPPATPDIYWYEATYEEHVTYDEVRFKDQNYGDV